MNANNVFKHIVDSLKLLQLFCWLLFASFYIIMLVSSSSCVLLYELIPLRCFPQTQVGKVWRNYKLIYIKKYQTLWSIWGASIFMCPQVNYTTWFQYRCSIVLTCVQVVKGNSSNKLSRSFNTTKRLLVALELGIYYIDSKIAMNVYLASKKL